MIFGAEDLIYDTLAIARLRMLRRANHRSRNEIFLTKPERMIDVFKDRSHD